MIVDSIFTFFNNLVRNIIGAMPTEYPPLSQGIINNAMDSIGGATVFNNSVVGVVLDLTIVVFVMGTAAAILLAMFTLNISIELAKLVASIK